MTPETARKIAMAFGYTANIKRQVTTLFLHVIIVCGKINLLFQQQQSKKKSNINHREAEDEEEEEEVKMVEFDGQGEWKGGAKEEEEEEEEEEQGHHHQHHRGFPGGGGGAPQCAQQ